jgi:hypothetical protein
MTVFTAILLYAGTGMFELLLKRLAISIGLRLPGGEVHGLILFQERGTTIIDQIPTALKAVFVILSLPTIINILKGKVNKHTETTGVLFAGIMFIGLVSLPVSGDMFGRALKIGYLFWIGVVGVFIHQWIGDISIRKITAAVFIIMVIAGSVPNGVAPSMVDDDVDINADKYHDVQPIGVQGPAAGQWISNYFPSEKIIYSRYYNAPIVFYYGDAKKRQYTNFRNPLSGWMLRDSARPIRTQGISFRAYDNGRVILEGGENVTIVP